MIKALRALYSKELQEEKRKDYRNVVGTQAVLLTLSLLADDLPVSDWANFVMFQLCAAVYLGLLWDLSRNFTFQRWLPNTLGLTALSVVLVSGIYNFVLWTPETGRYVNAVLHGLTVGMQAVVMSLGLRDLVRGPRNAADKLWAAAGIYLMLGIIFAELLHCLHLLRPDTLGVGVPANVRGFHEALYVSFVTLTGADNDLKGTSHLCRNLLVFEALLSQLYLVMLISRLLVGEEDSRESVPASRPPAGSAGPDPLEGSGEPHFSVSNTGQ